MNTHEYYMQQALRLAKRSQPSPNPRVGCVIVNNGVIVGRGYHKKAGGPHAEIFALKEAGSLAKNACVYVTLEPCCHHGKTPPCSNALIEAGIKKLVIACKDENPLVNGTAIEQIRESGIEVEYGICESAANSLNEAFFHFIKTKTPFVTVKWAMSLDGQTITSPLDTPDISSAESRQFSHQFRSQVDAILIGANTARLDNPLLTARHKKTHNTKQPLRIVVSSDGKLSPELKIFNTETNKTILVTTQAMSKSLLHQFTQKNIQILFIKEQADRKVHLHSLLIELGKLGISNLLVEGGMQIVNGFFAANLVNRVHVYLAPKIIAHLNTKHSLTNLKVKKINTDFYFCADY